MAKKAEPFSRDVLVTLVNRVDSQFSKKMKELGSKTKLESFSKELTKFLSNMQ